MDIKSFTDDQLAGQRIMAGFEGTGLNDDLKYLIDTIKVGGLILFACNLSSPQQIKKLCKSVQDYAASCGQPPLFIAIDQEGGTVARLKEPFTQFPDGSRGIKEEDDAAAFARVTAEELTEIGINMNMAPVMDVEPEGFNGIMGKRVFSHDAQEVARLGVKIIDILQEKKIMAVAKHFPGIGRTTLDSHIDMPFLDTEKAVLGATDFIPFEAAVRHNVSGIMLSHIVYHSIDPDWPASLSKRIVRDLLRDQMGYDGVVMTDDLDMGSIKKHYDIKTAVSRIVSADVDITLICHKSPDIQNAFQEIQGMLQGSSELKEKGIASVKRIIKLKKKYLF